MSHLVTIQALGALAAAAAGVPAWPQISGSR